MEKKATIYNLFSDIIPCSEGTFITCSIIYMITNPSLLSSSFPWSCHCSRLHSRWFLHLIHLKNENKKWLIISVLGLNSFPVFDHLLLQMNSNINAMSNDSNPFDCVFGIPPRVEEINHPASSITSSRRQSRSQKRSHRRQRMRKREASSTSEHADLVPMWHVNLW